LVKKTTPVGADHTERAPNNSRKKEVEKQGCDMAGKGKRTNLLVTKGGYRRKRGTGGRGFGFVGV